MTSTRKTSARAVADNVTPIRSPDPTTELPPPDEELTDLIGSLDEVHGVAELAYDAAVHAAEVSTPVQQEITAVWCGLGLAKRRLWELRGELEELSARAPLASRKGAQS